MKISKEELEKRLARQSEIFSDYLFLARRMAKHDFTVFYQNLLSHIDISYGSNSVTLENNQFTDYQWECTVCSQELKQDSFSVHRIIDGLKEVFDFKLIEESKRLISVKRPYLMDEYGDWEYSDISEADYIPKKESENNNENTDDYIVLW